MASSGTLKQRQDVQAGESPRDIGMKGASRTTTGLETPTTTTRSVLQSLETETPPVRPTARTQEPPEWNFWVWFDKYLAAIFGIAVLGGQVTFTLIVSDIADPATLFDGHQPFFSKEAVRFLIATSWLFFTFTLGVVVVVSLLFTGAHRGKLVYRFRKFERLFGFMVTFLLNFLPIGAFLMLSLATAAYVPLAGWLGTAFIGVFGLAVFYIWIFGW